MSRRGATAAAPSPLLLSFGVLVLALTPDPTASFAGGGPNPPAGHRQRYRRPTAPYSGRRRSTLIPAAGPSTPSPSPSPKRPAAAVAKKKGVGSVKFGGRVSRPLQGDGPDSKGEEEEDVRKSARWGAKPPSPPEIKIPKVLDVGAFKNPLDGVGKSLRKVGQGVTAAKDAVYGVADAAGSVAEQLQGAAAKGPLTPADGKTAAPQPLATKQAAPAGGGEPRADGVKQALRLLGGGVVATKDAFWGSLDVLGAAVDAATKAPETAKDLMEGGKAALEGVKENAEAVKRAPAQAAEAVSEVVDSVSGVVGSVSEAVGTAGKAVGTVKEGAYGAVDAVGRLANMPAEMAEKRRREQEARLERERKTAADRKAASAKLGAAVEGAKTVVWGTVEGVETIVDTVVATPAAVGDGLGKAKEAVSSASELLESIPRTVQEIPIEAQKTVDGVLASVASTQKSAEEFVSGVKGGVDSVSSLAQKAAAVATGKEKQEREERERREAEARRKEKEKNALVTLQGQPYTAKDVAFATLKAVGATAKGAVVVGKGLFSVAKNAKSVPGEVTRTVLGPFYRWQQSQKRVRDALELSQAASAPGSTADTPPAPAPAAAKELSGSGKVGASSEDMTGNPVGSAAAAAAPEPDTTAPAAKKSGAGAAEVKSAAAASSPPAEKAAAAAPKPSPSPASPAPAKVAAGSKKSAVNSKSIGPPVAGVEAKAEAKAPPPAPPAQQKSPAPKRTPAKDSAAEEREAELDFMKQLKADADEKFAS